MEKLNGGAERGSGTIRKWSQTPLTSVFDGDGEAEAERVQEGVEAAELGIAPVGQHAVETLAVELGRLGQLGE